MKTQMLRLWRASGEAAHEVNAVRVGVLFVHRTVYWRLNGAPTNGKTWTISNSDGWSLGHAKTRRAAIRAVREFDKSVLPGLRRWRSRHGLNFAL